MFDKLLTQFAAHIRAPRGHPLENPAGFAGAETSPIAAVLPACDERCHYPSRAKLVACAGETSGCTKIRLLLLIGPKHYPAPNRQKLDRPNTVN
jgi:hypothetical protein